MKKTSGSPVAMIAGNKNFPLILAAKARELGRPVAVVAFNGVTDAALNDLADEITWVQLGQLQPMLDFFHKQAGVDRIMMAGGFSAEDLTNYDPDERAVALMEALGEMNNDSILAAVCDEFDREGLRVVGATEMMPELMAAPGVLGQVQPSEELCDDLRKAWSLAKVLGQLDVGQTAVVSEGRSLALEGADGTDATIVRGGRLGRRPAAVAKVAKPGQDLRFDLPVIGLGTMKALVEGGLGAMVVEAGYTLLFDREEVLKLADDNGIALLAWNVAT